MTVNKTATDRSLFHRLKGINCLKSPDSSDCIRMYVKIRVNKRTSSVQIGFEFIWFRHFNCIKTVPVCKDGIKKMSCSFFLYHSLEKPVASRLSADLRKSYGCLSSGE